MTWDDAAIATLRQLWAEGHTHAQIAKAMGCSRNTIIGKAYRLDLPARPNKSRFAHGSAEAAEAVNKRMAKVRARRAQSISDAVDMARAGYATVDIARELGAHLDTVRAWLREVGENRPRCVRQRQPRIARQYAATSRQPREPREPRATCQPPKPRAPRVVAPVVPKASHAALRYGVTGCRWPHGEPGREGFRFCEDPAVVPGKPYCAACASRAYVRPASGEARV